MAKKKSDDTQLITIPSADPTAGKASRLEKDANALTVQDADGLERAEEVLARAKLYDGMVHAMYDGICAATNAAHKEATGTRKKFLAPVLRAVETAKAKVEAYGTRLLKERQKAIEDAEAIAAHKTEAEAEEGGTDLFGGANLPDLASVPDAPKTDSGRLRFQEVVVVDVVDPDSVPREYCSPDLKKIQEVVDRLGVQTSIPGVTVTTALKGRMY